MFQRAVFGLVKPFLLEQTWNKPGTKPTQTIVYLMNNMNKLFLACGRIGLSPVGIAFVPAVLFQGRFPKQEGPEGKTPFTYTPNPPKSCTQTCNRTAPAVLPRHGLTAEYFSWSKPKETTKTGLPTISKWQIGLFLYLKPYLGGAATPQGGQRAPLRGSRGAAPARLWFLSS